MATFDDFLFVLRDVSRHPESGKAYRQCRKTLARLAHERGARTGDIAQAAQISKAAAWNWCNEDRVKDYEINRNR